MINPPLTSSYHCFIHIDMPHYDPETCEAKHIFSCITPQNPSKRKRKPTKYTLHTHAIVGKHENYCRDVLKRADSPTNLKNRSKIPHDSNVQRRGQVEPTSCRRMVRPFLTHSSQRGRRALFVAHDRVHPESLGGAMLLRYLLSTGTG